MIFEKLDLISNNKILPVRARTPTLTNSLYFRSSARRKFLQKHSERYKNNNDLFPQENYKSLYTVINKIKYLNKGIDVLQEKNNISKEKNQKTRYTRAYTPGEKMLDSFANGDYIKKEKHTPKITPRKAYKLLVDKTSKEIRNEGLSGWLY